MEFREYWNIARKRGWIILLVAMVAAVAALGVSLIMPETYRATIQLSINPARADWGLNQATKDLLRNYVLNIKSHRMTQEAINRAQLDMSTYDFLANLDVSDDASNLSITIQAESHDPEEARLMAQTLADVFVEERRQWNSRAGQARPDLRGKGGRHPRRAAGLAQDQVQHAGGRGLWGHRRRDHRLFPGMAAVGHSAHGRRCAKGGGRDRAGRHSGGQRTRKVAGPAKWGCPPGSSPGCSLVFLGGPGHRRRVWVR